jgi:hypothetical protein
MTTVLWLLLEFAASVIVGYVVAREIEYRTWGRLAIEVFTAAPMSTTPPTVTELHSTVTVTDWAEVDT